MAPSTRSKIQAAKAKKAKTMTKTSKLRKFSNQKSKTIKPKKISPKIISAKRMAGKKSLLKKTSTNKRVQKTAKVKKSQKIAKKENPGPSKPKTENGFNLDIFITEKLGPLNMENQKKIISDSSSSTLADLIKFNINLAHSVYNITDQESLEVILLALQPKVDDDSQDLSPSVRAAYKEVALYKDLLLLGDLPTITQEKRPLEWISAATSPSMPAQMAIMTSFLTLAIKMTGKKPAVLKLKMPGGKLSGKKRDEVTSYMAIMQTIIDAMSNGNKWDKMDKFAILRKMEKDFVKISAEF